VSAACGIDGCTVAETGRCALENDPESCPNRVQGVTVPKSVGREPATRASDVEGGIGAPVLEPPIEIPTFPPSTILGPEMIEAMMASRYVTLVGILGDPESGKTACLVSLYLLVSHARLTGWSFADSRSIMAFEQIARGARRWHAGHPPEQMTVHTEMSDHRRPGFLHLGLRRDADGRRIDLALPDLPGEWTTALVRTSNSERFAFMRSADVIWLVVDGGTLLDRQKRQGVITRLGQLVGRLGKLFDGRVPRLLLVVTYRDAGEVAADVLDRVTLEMAKHDATVEVVPVAPFSDVDSVDAGFGLASLVDATAGPNPTVPAFWPSTPPKPGTRPFLAYRRDA
jgi:hypothetical protein